MDPTRSARDEVVLQVPFNVDLGFHFDGREDGWSHAHFFADGRKTAFMGLHAGVLYSLLDVNALLAAAPQLGDAEHAVTHDIHVSFMKGVPTGARCDLKARVMRKGRTLVFIESLAEVDGKLVASAQITKSIVPLSRSGEGK